MKIWCIIDFPKFFSFLKNSQYVTETNQSIKHIQTNIFSINFRIVKQNTNWYFEQVQFC